MASRLRSPQPSLDFVMIPPLIVAALFIGTILAGLLVRYHDR